MTTKTKAELKRLRATVARITEERAALSLEIMTNAQNRNAGAILAEQEAGQAALLVLRLEFQLAEEAASAPMTCGAGAPLPFGVKPDDRRDRIEHARRKALFYAGFADGLRRVRAGK